MSLKYLYHKFNLRTSCGKIFFTTEVYDSFGMKIPQFVTKVFPVLIVMIGQLI